MIGSKKTLFLDQHRGAAPTRAVEEAMRALPPVPCSLHAPYFHMPEIEKALEASRQALYTLVDAHEEDTFVWTSSGEEAAWHVVYGVYLDVARKTGKNHFVCGATDDAAVLLALSRLRSLGCTFDTIPVDAQGCVSVEAVVSVLTPRTALVSLAWAQGLTGVVQPLGLLAAVLKERGVLLHVEASHVLGRGAYSFQECGADFLSFDGPAFQGPWGTGGLFIRHIRALSPLLVGGNGQEGLRAGALSVPAVVGLGAAAREAWEATDHVLLEIARVRALFEEKVAQMCVGAQLVNARSERVATVSAWIFPGVHSETLGFLLAQRGIFAHWGGGPLQHIQHVLTAQGMEAPEIYEAISFGWGRMHTESDALYAAMHVAEVVGHLQRASQQIVLERGGGYGH